MDYIYWLIRCWRVSPEILETFSKEQDQEKLLKSLEMENLDVAVELTGIYGDFSDIFIELKKNPQAFINRIVFNFSEISRKCIEKVRCVGLPSDNIKKMEKMFVLLLSSAIFLLPGKCIHGYKIDSWITKHLSITFQELDTFEGLPESIQEDLWKGEEEYK